MASDSPERNTAVIPTNESLLGCVKQAVTVPASILAPPSSASLWNGQTLNLSPSQFLPNNILSQQPRAWERQPRRAIGSKGKSRTIYKRYDPQETKPKQDPRAAPPSPKKVVKKSRANASSGSRLDKSQPILHGAFASKYDRRNSGLPHKTCFREIEDDTMRQGWLNVTEQSGAITSESSGHHQVGDIDPSLESDNQNRRGAEGECNSLIHLTASTPQPRVSAPQNIMLGVSPWKVPTPRELYLRYSSKRPSPLRQSMTYDAISSHISMQNSPLKIAHPESCPRLQNPQHYSSGLLKTPRSVQPARTRSAITMEETPTRASKDTVPSNATYLTELAQTTNRGEQTSRHIQDCQADPAVDGNENMDIVESDEFPTSARTATVGIHNSPVMQLEQQIQATEDRDASTSSKQEQESNDAAKLFLLKAPPLVGISQRVNDESEEEVAIINEAPSEYETGSGALSTDTLRRDELSTIPTRLDGAHLSGDINAFSPSANESTEAVHVTCGTVTFTPATPRHRTPSRRRSILRKSHTPEMGGNEVNVEHAARISESVEAENDEEEQTDLAMAYEPTVELRSRIEVSTDNALVEADALSYHDRTQDDLNMQSDIFNLDLHSLQSSAPNTGNDELVAMDADRTSFENMGSREESENTLSHREEVTTVTIQLNDDQTVLRNFLSRSKAAKAAKLADVAALSNRRDSGLVKQALSSPRRALDEIDSNSPTSRKSADAELVTENHAINNAGLPSRQERDASNKNQRAHCDSTHTRRSTRNAGVHPKPSSGPQTITLRRQIDTAEAYTIKRSDTQELANTTRINTRRNKGGALSVKTMLARLKDCTGVPSPQRSALCDRKDSKEVKAVSWDVELVSYFEKETLSSNEKPLQETIPPRRRTAKKVKPTAEVSSKPDLSVDVSRNASNASTADSSNTAAEKLLPSEGESSAQKKQDVNQKVNSPQKKGVKEILPVTSTESKEKQLVAGTKRRQLPRPKAQASYTTLSHDDKENRQGNTIKSRAKDLNPGTAIRPSAARNRAVISRPGMGGHVAGR